MSIKFFWTLLFTLILIPAWTQSNESILNKAVYYKVFESNDLQLINKELQIIQVGIFHDKEAFEGALLMKKASLIANPKDKLATFKSGRTKLETSISKNEKNAEYRFLRLMIQENAPGIVHYKESITADSVLIKESYKALPVTVQQAIYEYSKKSTVLKTTELN